MTPKPTTRDREDLLEVYCSRCGEWKLTIDFSKKTSEKRNGLSAWCKECKRAYNRQYWREHYVPKKQTTKRTKGRAELAFFRR